MLLYSVILVVGILNLAVGYWAAVRLGFGPHNYVAARQTPVTPSTTLPETVDTAAETVSPEEETVQDEMLVDAVAESVGSTLSGIGDRTE